MSADAEPAPIVPVSEAVVASPPIDIYAEHAKWMALAGQRDFDGAIELCLSTIKKPETSFVASLFLGYAYFQSGRPAEAQRHLIPAVALNAGDFYANLLLAQAEKALGHPREALVRYMTCCTLEAASVVEPSRRPWILRCRCGRPKKGRRSRRFSTSFMPRASSPIRWC
ncbi:lipopolysaccharide assembly protein LapB [Variovorax sp. E3]|uniref:tetratricopeptide repeat protein n=1 Tax=Variovorax sp. E3 TaxID=1914993 RepID=UPI0018DC11C4|nr:hypothetical protein [Variovorax sp. E3]